MKKLYIAVASALALGLALSSLPAQAQKKVASQATPGGPGGIQGQPTSIPSNVETIQVIEEVVSVSKSASNKNITHLSSLSKTYRLEPTGKLYGGPMVRICMKYNSGATVASDASSALKTALKTMLKEVKNKDGKATYTPVSNDAEDDKINSQMCMLLKTF